MFTSGISNHRMGRKWFTDYVLHNQMDYCHVKKKPGKLFAFDNEIFWGYSSPEF